MARIADTSDKQELARVYEYMLSNCGIGGQDGRVLCRDMLSSATREVAQQEGESVVNRWNRCRDWLQQPEDSCDIKVQDERIAGARRCAGGALEDCVKAAHAYMSGRECPPKKRMARELFRDACELGDTASCLEVERLSRIRIVGP